MKMRLGAEAETLSSKTKIQAYYGSEFEDFLTLFGWRREYEDSMATLWPLLTRIEETDRLIDGVVYKLYGLTEE
ncbi:MAG: hypothetical protein JRD89_14580 [Deltaproteobacteria bacterium]|nr:hypothetical protein [Deltaproteobacteria bacterium]